MKSVFKILLVVSLLAFVFDVGREWVKLSSFNESPLNIVTFDGSNSPYHPSVKYFEKGWNNYKYWMAETPFHPEGKPYRDRIECPSIHVSNDGLHWTEIIENPLDDLDSAGIKNLDYFSDPHLVIAGDTLECWYRINKRFGDPDCKANVFLLCKKSVDGTHWSSTDTLFNFTNVQNREFVSPAILKTDTTYQMWYVDNYKIYYKESRDPKKWEEASLCDFSGYDFTPWHIDVIQTDGFYWLLSYDYKHDELTLWKSNDRQRFEFVKRILTSSHAIGSFYEEGLYRSCLLKQSDNLYRIYFSAADLESTHIGVLEGNSFEDLKIVSIDNEKNCDFAQFIRYYFELRKRTICFLLNHITAN